MQKCLKCGKVDQIIKSGIVRNKQRFFCKTCEFSFVIKNEMTELGDSNKNTTIIDIARELNISVSTVSRALNNKKDINIKTKKLIEETAEKLNYQPNYLAQSLHQGISHIIGVIVPDIKHPYFAKVLAGIHNIINNTGYSIIVCHSDESLELENLHIEKLISYRVDGILISHVKSAFNQLHLNKIKKHRIPIVQFDRVIRNFESPVVLNNDLEGSFETVNSLITNGFKRIGIILGPNGLDISDQRFEGYKKALEQNNIKILPDLIVHSDLTQTGAKNAFYKLINLEIPPDAIYTSFINDAVEIMQTAKKQNMKIPEDIAVATFGDDNVSEIIFPPLTGYNSNPTLIGEKAVSILIDIMSGKKDTENIEHIVDGHLILRASSLKD